MTELSTPKPGSLADAAAVPRASVAWLFERLTAQFGARMADLYAAPVDASAPPDVQRRTAATFTQRVQEEWALGLAGYHREEIQRGLAACRERGFAPNLGEFVQLCRPGLNPEWAWHEARDCLRQRDAGAVGNWSHPAIWRAASEMSPEVRGGDYQRHRTRWTYVLRREFAAGWGEAPPKPAMRVEHNAKVRGPRAEEREALAGLRSLHAKTAARAAAITEEGP